MFVIAGLTRNPSLAGMMYVIAGLTRNPSLAGMMFVINGHDVRHCGLDPQSVFRAGLTGHCSNILFDD